MSIHRKSKHDINLMKQAGNIVALVHAAMKESVKEGITTQELNDIAYIDEETHKKQLNTALEQNDVLLNITGERQENDREHFMVIPKPAQVYECRRHLSTWHMCGCTLQQAKGRLHAVLPHTK